MGTVVKRYIYDGGMGITDRQVVIGYCNENKKEVLKKLLKNYVIHSYGKTYCNTINDYPFNSEGICIYDYEPIEYKGLKTIITGNLEDILKDDQFQKFKNNRFTNEKFLDRILEMQKHHDNLSEDNTYRKIYKKIIEDFKEIYKELPKEV